MTRKDKHEKEPIRQDERGENKGRMERIRQHSSRMERNGGKKEGGKVAAHLGGERTCESRQR